MTALESRATTTGFILLADAWGTSVERFDILTAKWTAMAPLIVARMNFSLVAWQDDLFAIGGYDMADNKIKVVERYNIRANSGHLERDLDLHACCSFINFVE